MKKYEQTEKIAENAFAKVQNRELDVEKVDNRKKTASAPKEKKKTYEERQKDKLLAQKRRRETSLIFQKRTKSGQPVMKGRIEHLYGKILKAVKQ